MGKLSISAYGSGDGYGYGSGDGSGGDNEGYWADAVDGIVESLPEEARDRVASIVSDGAVLAYWKSNANGYPSNGGNSWIAAAPGVIHEVSGPLEICTHRALHATFSPKSWKGERLWLVALHGEISVGDDKLAALKREIICDTGIKI